MRGWAVDIGTTNTGIACWDDDKLQPRLIELPRICRRPGGDDPLEAPVLIPSVVEFLSRTKLIDRIGAWRPLEHWMLLGSTALIGQRALNRNQALANPAFVPGFKTALAWEPTRPVARLNKHVVTAREAARAFLRELFAEVKRETGHRIRDLVATVPVDAYEGYRAQLQDVARSLGVRRLRFVDEPLAAALGYGLGIASDRNVLVVDIGGGTMHVALLRLTAGGVEQGHAEILAKQGRQLGGDTVDSWLLDQVCRRMGYDLHEPAESEEMRLWRRLMLAEACRVKESLFFRPAE